MFPANSNINISPVGLNGQHVAPYNPNTDTNTTTNTTNRNNDNDNTDKIV